MGVLAPRRPEHGDVTKIPTPPLQQVALFLNFFVPALSVVFVALRAYSRIKTRQWGLDDYLILVALLCALLMCGPFYMCKFPRKSSTEIIDKRLTRNSQTSSLSTLAGGKKTSPSSTPRPECGGSTSPSSSTTPSSPS